MGHLVRRLHRDPGRRAAAAAPARDRAGHGHRRPLSRRRPLPRRLRHGQRAVAVRGQPGRDERDAARCRRSAAPAWRDEWRARLEATPPWLFAWLRHQTDGPYWRQGSLAPDYDAIEAADLQHRRLARLVRRPGLPDAGALPCAVAHARRQLGPLLAARRRARAQPRRAPRDRPVLRPPPARRRRTAGTTSRRSSGSSATTRRRSRSRRRCPGRWRAATAYPAPGDDACGAGPSRVEVPRLAVRPSDAATAAPGVDTFRHRPTTGTRGALSWGAGGAPNGLARDLRARRGRRADLHLARRSASRSRSSASRGRRPPRGRRAGRDARRSGCPTWRRTGRSRWSAPASST